MIKNIIYVKDGSVDVDELRLSLGEDTKIIVYRQGATKPVIEQLANPIQTSFNYREREARNEKTLNDYSWEEIKQAVENYYINGEVPFKVGEKKEIFLKDNSSAFIVFYGKEYGYEEEFNEHAPLIFGFLDLVGKDDNGGAQMNEGYTNKGGWETCKMRKYLNKDFITLLPDELVALLKAIKKKTVNKSKKVSVTEDKIFLPSEVEVFGKMYYSAGGEGYQYDFFKNWRNRVKGYNDGEHGRWWWLRSPYSGSSNLFCVVDAAGSYTCYTASYSSGVSPCFAL